MDIKQQARELVGQMTLEEKGALCSGKDFWHLKGIDRLGLAPVMVTDGPHGLRKQEGDSDHLGINRSVPATCFPAACATANSFDPGLLREIGAAIGEECIQEDVAVVLGPGVNIKRSPLCGRNFEYFSEDPYLTGKMGAALVDGVQSKGVGTSVKHYAVNNQETRRMSINSVVDQRAMREIYLAAYETIVKEVQPWTLMCAYNLVNGTYASDNKWLENDVLRDEWGFEGLVMTDWGAMNDRVKGLDAGLDLEMPGSGGFNDAQIVKAVQKGELPVAVLDKAASRVTELILRYQANRRPDFRYDVDAHNALARRAAAQSCVLLKNEGGVLPLKAGAKLAVVGALAKKARYQGAGSSKINPIRLDNCHDALADAGFDITYAEGYSLKPGSAPDDDMIEAACIAAGDKDAVLIFAGLPDEYESEGFDRAHLNMPDSHNRLIEAVAAVNPNTIVVLQLGAPVRMPWADKVRGILLAYLGGQAGGGGCADILLGTENPGGKLAESWPLALEDTPSCKYFPGGGKSVEYRESIFVGYRYYDRAEKPVAFPFGYGLSYTSFEYGNLAVDPEEDGGYTVSFTIKNTGACAGAEIAQLYVGLQDSKIMRPVKELKGFDKVFLQPGESRTVRLALNRRSFAYYNTAAGGWAVEGGEYDISVGASSRDIRLSAKLEIQGDGRESALESLRKAAPDYFNLPGGTLQISDDAFAVLYGAALPPGERLPKEPFTASSTLADIKDTVIGKMIIKQIKAQAAKMLEDLADGGDIEAMAQAMLMDMPLRALGMMSGGALTPVQVGGIVDMLNGRLIKGILKMKGSKKKG